MGPGLIEERIAAVGYHAAFLEALASFGQLFLSRYPAPSEALEDRLRDWLELVEHRGTVAQGSQAPAEAAPREPLQVVARRTDSAR